MSKTIYTMLISVWIITPIMMVNVANTEPNNSESESDEQDFGNPLLADPSGIENWQVHSACRSAMYAEDATEKQMGQLICRMAQDMIYEQNIYHKSYTTFFEQKKYEEALYVINVYSVTGCDITDLGRADFTAYIIYYFDQNEAELKDNFYWTMDKVLKPYCDELRDASIEFHLEENEDRRIS
tara:strand:- start:2 stop:550 length:549 start_codon:yes stop_codon:yes gene_type:complete